VARDPQLQNFVEEELGVRVERTGASHEYNTGIQMQWIDKDGKVYKVAPTGERELKMFDLLCTPQAEWGK
jgi:hypothetical protein